jgi:threonylcarbamoyladenosine tRNA methylthiotransferase MtaB
LCSDEIIEFVAGSQRFVPHFHMPLQSGSDKILRLMRRRYVRDLYANRVQHIKALMPHACIGADVIVGFPGETEADFMETFHFLNDLDVSYLHVFTYSERANTPAPDMGGTVPVEERRRRNEMLSILSEKKRRHFYEQHVGQERPVLFEMHKDPTLMSGFTDNYIKIDAPFEANRINTMCRVRLKQVTRSGNMAADVLYDGQPLPYLAV